MQKEIILGMFSFAAFILFCGFFFLWVGRGFSATVHAVVLLESWLHKKVSKWLWGECFWLQSRQRLIMHRGKCRQIQLWLLSAFNWCCHGLGFLCVAALAGWPGEGVLPWREHLLCSFLLGIGSTLLREGGFISSDYLYPLLMQSQICGWETGSFGIKNPPGPNAFCLLYQLPNSCHVWGGMDYGVTSWGSRLKLSLGRLATFFRTDFGLPGLKSTSQGISPHWYRVCGHNQRPLVIRFGAKARMKWARWRGGPWSQQSHRFVALPAAELAVSAGMWGSEAWILFDKCSSSVFWDVNYSRELVLFPFMLIIWECCSEGCAVLRKCL